MNTLKNSIRQYSKHLEHYLQFEPFTGKTYDEWIEPLLASITEDGAISYLLGSENNERYRASPLASTLLWMCESRLLPEDAINIMQDKLLFLRDNCEDFDKHKGTNEKKVEDEDGWSLAEGVSVWSTSMAIIALMDNTGIGLSKCEHYKKSLLWLIKQQKVGDKGWGYQLSANCKENVIMTALVLRVIALALINKDNFNFDSNEEHLMYSALNNGFQYLKETIKYSIRNTEVFWCFEEKEHCAATVWALLALKKMKQLNYNPEITTFYEENVQKGITFVLKSIPSKCVRWEEEQIGYEAGAKYNKQKNYYSFSPTLILNLLELGVSPYHPKVVSQIKWLIHNVEQWKIEKYDRSEVCSFTYAMVISVIAKWEVLVGQENARLLINNPEHKLDILLKYIIGMPIIRESNIQMVKISNLTFSWLITLFLLVLFFKGKDFYYQIVSFVEPFLSFIFASQNSIILDIISSTIYAILIFIITLLFKLLTTFIRRLR